MEKPMDITEYNNLLKNYESSSMRICIEKCCSYKFMFLLNNNARLTDLYNYVIEFYSHVTEPIVLYLDSNHTNMLPNNQILLSKYLGHKNILSCTQLGVPVVYKFYLDICCKHKDIYNQNYHKFLEYDN